MIKKLSEAIREAREEIDSCGNGPTMEDLLDWMIEAEFMEKRLEKLPHMARDFHQSASDACPMECSEAEDYERRFALWASSHGG